MVTTRGDPIPKKPELEVTCSLVEGTCARLLETDRHRTMRLREDVRGRWEFMEKPYYRKEESQNQLRGLPKTYFILNSCAEAV
jgi:hypothetical protein